MSCSPPQEPACSPPQIPARSPGPATPQCATCETTITHDDLAKLKSIKRAFTRKGWIFELKYDGFRVLAKSEGTGPSLVSCNGTDLLRCFPEIGQQLRALPPIVLDGELVVLDKTGRPRFDRLRRRFAMRLKGTIARTAITYPAAIYAFDVLMIGDRDIRRLPLEQRKSILKDVLKGSERIRYLDHIGEEGERLYAMAVLIGLEGIVAKSLASKYHRGYDSGWLKIKTAAGLATDAERRKWNE